MSAQKPHLILLDGSGFLHRAWSVAPRERNAAGLEIGATKTFSMMVMKLLHRMDKGRIPPTGVCVFLDDGGRDQTWRRAISPAYKANRPDHDPSLLAQIPVIQEMCEAIGLRTGMVATHEADDLIAAYAEDGHAAGMNVGVISSDKDLMQIVRKGIMQFHPQTEKWFNSAKVEEKFGVGPELVADSLALTGDASDGVAGAPGVGVKIAAKLLREFGSLEELLANAEHIRTPACRKAVMENADTVRLARRLVSLDAVGCPRPFSLDAVTSPDPRFVWDQMEAWKADRLATLVPGGDAPRPD